jgi:opacity protein-like surface antigen
MGSTKDKYFAMQGMVGFNFELNENMLVGIEYRYKTSISGALYDTMASHSGILSIRANF